jgi:hypothetical protein
VIKEISNVKAQISNQVQRSNANNFLILEFDIDLAFGF